MDECAEPWAVWPCFLRYLYDFYISGEWNLLLRTIGRGLESNARHCAAAQVFRSRFAPLPVFGQLLLYDIVGAPLQQLLLPDAERRSLSELKRLRVPPNDTIGKRSCPEVMRARTKRRFV